MGLNVTESDGEVEPLDDADELVVADTEDVAVAVPESVGEVDADAEALQVPVVVEDVDADNDGDSVLLVVAVDENVALGDTLPEAVNVEVEEVLAVTELLQVTVRDTDAVADIVTEDEGDAEDESVDDGVELSVDETVVETDADTVTEELEVAVELLDGLPE